MPPTEQSGDSGTTPKVSFASHIAPYFAQYADEMRWRMNLIDYTDVKDNADMIYSRISDKTDNRMPPPMYPALNQSVIDNFRWWMDNGFPP